MPVTAQHPLDRDPTPLEIDMRRVAMATRTTARSTRFIAIMLGVLVLLAAIGMLVMIHELDSVVNTINSPT